MLSACLLLASYEEEAKRRDVPLYRIQYRPHAGHLLTADVDLFGFVVGRVDATTIASLDDMKVVHPDDVVRLDEEEPSMPSLFYADGAAKGNPGPSGWVYLPIEPDLGRRIQASGSRGLNTNTHAQLTAIVSEAPEHDRVDRLASAAAHGTIGWAAVRGCTGRPSRQARPRSQSVAGEFTVRGSKSMMVFESNVARVWHR